jgi:hypothetical protein
VTMKATSDQLAAVTVAVRRIDTAERRARYRAGDYPRSETTKDVARRYRWDTYYAAISAGLLTYDVARDLNDAHMDTLLRRAMPDGVNA